MKKGKSIIKHMLMKNQYINWYIHRKRSDKKTYENIIKNYNKTGNLGGNGWYKPYVINVIDGTILHGGLTDRLRGAISTYAICKEKILPYRLYFTYPFNLEDFLIPNQYEWRISNVDVCGNIRDCNPVILFPMGNNASTEVSAFQFHKQKNYLRRHINRSDKQTIVFTNAAFAYNLDYSNLFNELFKPSIKLQTSINRQIEILGPDYISVHARFLDLLGDFKEPIKIKKRQLPEIEAQKLIQTSVEQIMLIHDRYPDKKILINSDSTRFIRACSELEYTYSIPGNITHIDMKQSDEYYGNYERYEKTFLDFMVMANSEKIFLLKGNNMRKSGYSFAASKIYNREFTIIKY